MPKITRLAITSYRGVRDLSVEIPPEGAIVSGGNARGKSSVLKAITAALAGQGIGPDSIRVGADHAEILVDLDAFRVRRSITEKGSSLTVKNAEGDNWSKPQTRLNDILGTCALDALSFFLAKPAERRQQILEALPVAITTEDVARWTGSTKILDRVSIEGHGLEALERLRKVFYDIRADLNREGKAARAKADAAAPTEPPIEDAIPMADARAARDAADQALRELRARETTARGAHQASERTRARIATLKEEVTEIGRNAPRAPTAEELAAATASVDAAFASVKELRAKVAAAEDAYTEALGRERAVTDQRSGAENATKKAVDLANQIGELQASIADIDAMAVPEAEIAAADQALTARAADLAKSEAADRRANAVADAAQLAANADTFERKAAAVDEVVRKLTTSAPTELAARANLIPGLAFDGDAITLDGVSLSDLSGAEQMKFAVDLCKRLNAKAGILVVDGLERLDDDSLETFVETATAGGWQLIGTRVSRGELVVEALTPSGLAAEIAEKYAATRISARAFLAEIDDEQ